MKKVKKGSDESKRSEEWKCRRGRLGANAGLDWTWKARSGGNGNGSWPKVPKGAGVQKCKQQKRVASRPTWSARLAGQRQKRTEETGSGNGLDLGKADE